MENLILLKKEPYNKIVNVFLNEKIVWFFIFLFGIAAVPGVPGSDYVGLINWEIQFSHGNQNYFNFLAVPQNQWIFDHQFGFFITYLFDILISSLHFNLAIKNWLLSAFPSLSGSLSYAVIYSYLIRYTDLNSSRSLCLVLLLGIGSYGSFVSSADNPFESFMTMIMACRLFVADRSQSTKSGIASGIFDGLLVALKPYAFFYVLAETARHLRRYPQNWLKSWLPTFSIILIIMVIILILSWNNGNLYLSNYPSIMDYIIRIFDQYVDFQTGMVWCAPVLWVLLFLPKQYRTNLYYKIAGIFTCTLFFAKFKFFDGDIPGGRYVFPFLIGLVPELATGLGRLLDRSPRSSYMLPVLIMIFLPIVDYRMTTYNTVPLNQRTETCKSKHPAIYAWRVVLASSEPGAHLDACYHGYVVRPEIARIDPNTGISRIFYILAGGTNRGHEREATQLKNVMDRFGLDSTTLWQIFRFALAGFLLAISGLLSWIIAASQASAAVKRPQFDK